MLRTGLLRPLPLAGVCRVRGVEGVVVPYLWQRPCPGPPGALETPASVASCRQLPSTDKHQTGLLLLFCYPTPAQPYSSL